MKKEKNKEKMMKQMCKLLEAMRLAHTGKVVIEIDPGDVCDPDETEFCGCAGYDPKAAEEDAEDGAENDPDDDEDEGCRMNHTVLYAAPGEPDQLMLVTEAVKQFPWEEDELTLNCYEIREHLFLHFLAAAFESAEEITVCGPVYIASMNEDDTECVELTASDFLAASAFLKKHSVTITVEGGRTYCGYSLPVENEED